MGCSNSKPEKSVVKSTEQPAIVRDGSLKPVPLTALEIQARIECPTEMKLLEIGGFKMKYAWVSQRGYYPDSLDKENQDAYAIVPVFGNPDDQQAFFAVYDGHGKEGQHCARFARDMVGKTIQDKLGRIPMGGVNSKTIKQVLNVAHYLTNDSMHADKRFDDSLSGTTAISILFSGKTMYVSNVGDSRAIVVSKTEDGRLVAKPLSSDQTPYRKDERERIKKYGARILSMDQIEGIEPIHENWGDLNLGEDIDEGGDPPRVWSTNGDYPGTAFTRSLGDVFAEECGVIPEPEILERDIHPNDKFIVIASDGVFEFLTNQMVAEMLSHYTDPLEGCKAVVATAYEMWLQYEVRTDDITIIAMYIDDSNNKPFHKTSSFYANTDQKGSSGSLRPSTSSSAVNNLPASHNSNSNLQLKVESMESRPVRRAMSREKRKFMIQLKSDEEEENTVEGPVEEVIIEKSEGEETVILSAMRNNFLFQHLNTTQRQTVVNVMTPVEVKKGQWIIKQGDAGDKFYIVDNGKFEVRVKMGGPAATAPPTLGTDEEAHKKALEDYAGNVVHVYESGIDQHPGFGELSLMYGKPRAASVIALTDGKLWALDRKIFRHLVLRPKDYQRNHILKILKKVELFSCLNITQLQRLIDLLHERQYAAGEKIITQGEFGDTFYLIVSGQCDCSINNAEDPSKPPMVVMKLSDYAYFGERALLESKPRAANVTATSDMKVMYIEKHAFEEVLGPLAKIVEDDRVRREALAAEALSRPKTIQDITLQGQILLDSMGPILIGQFGSLDAARVANPPGTPRRRASLNQESNGVRHSNVTMRSFSLTEIMKGALSESVVRYVEAVKYLKETSSQHVQKSTVSLSGLVAEDWREVYQYLVPQCITILKESNAIHLVFESCIVSDLSSFIRNHSEEFVVQGAANSEGIAMDIDSEKRSSRKRSISYLIPYSIANIILALEFLHKHEIMYRAIQPEAIYLNAQGQLVLMDYRYCKIGVANVSTEMIQPPSSPSTNPMSSPMTTMIRQTSLSNPPAPLNTSPGGNTNVTGNNNKAFTLCGIADYLAPEQIAQTGHSYSVDFWAMGVLLYELTVGSHPFASSTEVATYSKISSFGTKAFPSLKFPEGFPSNIKSLINQLLVPTPEARIGTGMNGFQNLKKHAFFEQTSMKIALAAAMAETAGGPVPQLNSVSASMDPYDTVHMAGIALDIDEPLSPTTRGNNASTIHSWWDALEKCQIPSPFLFYTQEEEQVIIAEGVEESTTAIFTQPFEQQNTAWLEQLQL